MFVSKKYLMVGVFNLFLLSVGFTQFGFSDGTDSPSACEGTPTDDWSEIETSITYDAGSGNTIDEICLKSGSNSFGGSSHSGVINTDGTYGDGNVANTCYTVSGLGTQMVTVTETGAAGCKSISHVDGVPPGDMIGGSGVPIEQASLLISGMKATGSYMIPILMAAAGFGILIARRF